MRVACDLKVMDGTVLCPRGGRWTDTEVCRDCRYLHPGDTGESSGSVRCTPEIDSLSHALFVMTHTSARTPS